MKINHHIFLTGFMGSGKSTVGKKTATLLDLPFKDLDTEIESGEKKSIAGLFSEIGEGSFRTLESAYLERLIKDPEPAFISLGGGTICFHGNLEKIKANGLLIYIQMPAAALARRLEQSTQERPLLKDLKGELLVEEIEKKLNARKSYYEAAHIIVNGVNLTAQALQRTIIDAIPKNTH